MFSTLKTIASWLFLLLCLVLIWGAVERGRDAFKSTETSYSDFLKSVQNGQVQDAVIRGADLWGHLKDSPNDQFHTTLPADRSDLIQRMVNTGVEIQINPPRTSLLEQCLRNGPVVFIVYPILLAIPAVWFIFRKAGIHPVFSVLLIVPIVNLVMLYVVAFSKESASPVRRF